MFGYGNDCSVTGSLEGNVAFSDEHSDQSDVTVIFQYAPDCYVSDDVTGVAVFDGQNTEVEDVTLERRTPTLMPVSIFQPMMILPQVARIFP